MNTTILPITRRRFLADSTKVVSALAVAPALIARADAPGDRRKLSANDKLDIAFIGVTWRGGDNIKEITSAIQPEVCQCKTLPNYQLPPNADCIFQCAKLQRIFKPVWRKIT